MTRVPEEALWLGSGTIPTGQAQCRALIRSALTEAGAQLSASALDRLVVTYAEPPAIAEASLDLSGVRIDPIDGADDAEDHVPQARLVEVEQPAGIEKLTVRAEPLHLQEADIGVELDADQVAFSWLRDTEGGLWINLPEQQPDGFGGRAALTFNVTDVVAVVRTIVEKEVGEKGKLSEFDATLEVQPPQEQQQRISVNGVLAFRYGIVGARVRVAAVGRLHNADGRVVLEDLKVTSRHPLLALGLRIYRSMITRVVGRSWSPSEAVPGVTVTNVEITQYGNDIRGSCEFS